MWIRVQIPDELAKIYESIPNKPGFIAEALKSELLYDYVWCNVHGCIHEKTENPFSLEFDDPECTSEDWQDVFVSNMYDVR